MLLGQKMSLVRAHYHISQHACCRKSNTALAGLVPCYFSRSSLEERAQKSLPKHDVDEIVTLIEPQSRFADETLKFQGVFPKTGLRF